MKFFYLTFNKTSLRRLLLTIIIQIIFLSIAYAEQNIDWVKVEPGNIFINQSTTVTVTANISPDPDLIPASVYLFRNENSIMSNLGRLYDDGSHGDVTPNDGIFTSQVVVNEPFPKEVFFAVSAAYKGTVRRTLRDFIVCVKTVTEPEQIRATVVSLLRSGDIENVKIWLAGSDSTKLQSLNLAVLADLIENATLKQADEDYRSYLNEWIDELGVNHSYSYNMILNDYGQWMITCW
jgi:hypothetical protein